MEVHNVQQITVFVMKMACKVMLINEFLNLAEYYELNAHTIDCI